MECCLKGVAQMSRRIQIYGVATNAVGKKLYIASFTYD